LLESVEAFANLFDTYDYKSYGNYHYMPSSTPTFEVRAYMYQSWGVIWQEDDEVDTVHFY